MKQTFLRCILAAAPGAVLIGVAGLAPAVAAADEAKPTVSREAGKELQAAQKAIQDHKYSEALSHLDAVAGNTKKNEYDTYLMNEFYLQAYNGTGRQAEAVKAAEAVLDSKYASPQRAESLINAVAATYFNNLKQYDKAIEYAQRYIKAGYPDKGHAMHIVVAESYYLKDDFDDARKFTSGFVDDLIKAGETPSEDVLKLGLSANVKLDDQQGTSRWLERLVTYYPKPQYWQELLDGLLRAKTTDKQLLEIYRLAFEVGAVTHGEQYTEMAQVALDQGSPGIAVTVLQKAFDDNAFTDNASKNRNQHLMISAKQAAAQDQASLPKNEAEGAAAATGQLSVGVGIGYLGYGQYDKAAQDLAAGLKKGGVKDPINAQLLLGVAQLKAGNRDGAIQSFHQVKGDATLERVANLWVLHARS